MPYTPVSTVADGDDILASWGTDVSDAIGELQDAVPDATTTWSSPIAGGITVGSGTTTAKYTIAGKMVVAEFTFTFGAGSAITGDVTLTLPVTAATSGQMNGVGRFFDTSASARYLGAVIGSGTTTVALRAVDASASLALISGAATTLSSTVPFSWATGDTIVFTITYLAA